MGCFFHSKEQARVDERSRADGFNSMHVGEGGKQVLMRVVMGPFVRMSKHTSAILSVNSWNNVA